MACPAALVVRRGDGGGVVAANRLIPVRVGDIEIEVEAVPAAGTEADLGPGGEGGRERAGGVRPGPGRDHGGGEVHRRR